MSEHILLSTAYLPPIEYIWHILNSESASIETEENYPKQTYRNRCKILTSNGVLSLSIPVHTGDGPKTVVKDIRIDDTKRWRQNHLRALRSAYSSSPFFLYYFDDFEKIISSDIDYLLDLNMSLLELILKIIKIDTPILKTSSFVAPEESANDLRYSISPKKESSFIYPTYTHTFETNKEIEGLSIIYMIFNVGQHKKYIQTNNI
ncbi:MAG: WbqC family protein [Bacteroidales bacterium]|nr:WbqC family protein [Bacteroidales bacterium]